MFIHLERVPSTSELVGREEIPGLGVGGRGCDGGRENGDDAVGEGCASGERRLLVVVKDAVIIAWKDEEKFLGCW